MRLTKLDSRAQLNNTFCRLTGKKGRRSDLEVIQPKITITLYNFCLKQLKVKYSAGVVIMHNFEQRSQNAFILTMLVQKTCYAQ